MTNDELKVTQVREEAAFDDGAIAAFKALRDIYQMDEEDRYVLFGNKGLHALIHESPTYIFDVLNNKDTTLRQHVKVGDILARGEKDSEIRVVVTYVAPDGIHFDGIVLTDRGMRGSVWKNTTIDESHTHKTGDTTNRFDIFTHYDWE